MEGLEVGIDPIGSTKTPVVTLLRESHFAGERGRGLFMLKYVDIMSAKKPLD